MEGVFTGKVLRTHWIRERLLVLFISLLCQAQGLPQVFRSNDICGVYNGHRVYLELGDHGQLQATNVTIARVRIFLSSATDVTKTGVMKRNRFNFSVCT